jgi:hypothetical protein
MGITPPLQPQGLTTVHQFTIARTTFFLRFKSLSLLFFMIFFTYFVKGQNYPFLSGSPAALSNNNFIKISPSPAIPFGAPGATAHTLRFGKSYFSTPTRGVFYGGNLGVAQDIGNYGDYLGKWSFIGAWDKLYTTGSPSTVLGNDFLVNYHRWGDYMANFGLRAVSTSISGGVSTPSAMKDAVITWGYERGQTPNRLIFQSIEGVDYNGNTTNPDHYEWATILSNGNIGSGLPTPSAQLQLKPHITGSSSEPIFQTLNTSNNPLITFTKTGKIGIGVIPTTSVLDVVGDINVFGSQFIKSPSATGTYSIFSIEDNTTSPNRTIFNTLNNGKTWIDGHLQIISRPSAYAFTIVGNSGINRFTISDDGNVEINNGKLFLPTIGGSGLPTSPVKNLLSINSIGEVISEPVSADNIWVNGGNAISTVGVFGSNTNYDIEFRVGTSNILASKIHGASSTYMGSTEFNKPISVATTPNTDWGLTLKSFGITTVTQGPLNCLDNGGSSIFRISNGGNIYLDNLTNGSTYLDGELILKGRSSGAALPLQILNSTGMVSRFKITDGGDVYIENLSGSGTLNLKVDNNGKIIATSTAFSPNTIWEMGGNTFSSGSSHIFGSLSNHDIETKAGNTLAYIVHGVSSTYKGSTEFKKQTSVNTAPDNNWALTLKSFGTTALYEGPLSCLSTGWAQLFKIDNNGNAWGTNFMPINGSSDIGSNFDKFDEIWGLKFNGGVFKGDDVIGKKFSPETSGTSDIGSGISDQFDQIWGKTLQVSTRTISQIVETELMVQKSPTSSIGIVGTPFPFIYGDRIEARDLIVTNLFSPTSIYSGSYTGVNYSGTNMTLLGNMTANTIKPYTSGTSNIGTNFSDRFNQIWGTTYYGSTFLPHTTGTNNIGASGAGNGFDNIYGDNIYIDQLMPMSGGTGGTSTIGTNTSTGTWQHIWVGTGTDLVSDRRLKENINPIEFGLKTILNLKPYSYNYIAGDKALHHGFIAQELRNSFPNSVVHGTETDSTYLGVMYDEIIPILTKAIQEQQSIIESQEVDIDSLKQKLNLFFAANTIKENKNLNTQKESINQLPLLFQNHPNPFNGFTFIDYFLPNNITDAFLRVIDNTGKLVKAFPINKTGFGQIELDCSNLASGQYHYSLLVNSKLIDNKSMIISEAN